MIKWDIIINGLISDTVAYESDADPAKIMQELSEKRGLNIRSFYICKLRHICNLHK